MIHTALIFRIGIVSVDISGQVVVSDKAVWPKVSQLIAWLKLIRGEIHTHTQVP